MMILKENYVLRNGVNIPKLGLGTWMVPNEKAAQVVVDAVKIGYRHIDTAQAYMNESGVGEGIKLCGVDRDVLFITTKLAAEAKDYDVAKAAIDDSLAALGLEYIDLMLIHSPQPWMAYGEDENRCFEGNREAWRALEEAYKAGKLKSIGVSNFLKEDLENILSTCTVKPMVNQLLVHASNTPFDMLEYCSENDILVEAYSPIAHGEAMKNPVIGRIAEKYHVSIPQLCIRYDLQLGTLPLPKTANPEHMENNADVDFVISDEDMAELKGLDKIENYGESSFFPVYGGKLK
jgi:diketogulonate reductase-like aldo/keto reductase